VRVDFGDVQHVRHVDGTLDWTIFQEHPDDEREYQDWVGDHSICSIYWPRDQTDSTWPALKVGIMDLPGYDRKGTFSMSPHNDYDNHTLCVCYGDNEFYFVRNDTIQNFERYKVIEPGSRDLKRAQELADLAHDENVQQRIDTFTRNRNTTRFITMENKVVLEVTPSPDTNAIMMHHVQNDRREWCWDLYCFGVDITFEYEVINVFFRISRRQALQFKIRNCPKFLYAQVVALVQIYASKAIGQFFRYKASLLDQNGLIERFDQTVENLMLQPTRNPLQEDDIHNIIGLPVLKLVTLDFEREDLHLESINGFVICPTRRHSVLLRGLFTCECNGETTDNVEMFFWPELRPVGGTSKLSPERKTFFDAQQKVFQQILERILTAKTMDPVPIMCAEEIDLAPPVDLIY
jgi:hypothetical protein